MAIWVALAALGVLGGRAGETECLLGTPLQVEHTGGDIGIPEGKVEVGPGRQDPDLGNLGEHVAVSLAGLQRVLIESRLDEHGVDGHAVQ